VAQTIYQGIVRLRKFPNAGRIGLAENTRELIFSPWPYIAVYEIIDDQCRWRRKRVPFWRRWRRVGYQPFNWLPKSGSFLTASNNDQVQVLRIRHETVRAITRGLEGSTKLRIDSQEIAC
jgi:hypothetical protein